MTKMSNSPLVTYTKLSPNHSGLRTRKIDTITPHVIVGHLSLPTLGNVFASKSRNASSNYGIDDQGKVGMYVEEKNRSWCTSSAANDQRAVTIEIASDAQHPYAITDKALQGLIDLCVDICKRNDMPKLLWKADKSLIGQPTKQNITVHRWFKNKSCPGEYTFNKLTYVADEVNKILLPKKPEILPSRKVPYTARITTSTLNYRRGPGTNNPVVGRGHKDQIVTIVKEASGAGASKWGELENGKGWISLDFCDNFKEIILTSNGLPYGVKINATVLNYRRGPGTNHPIVGRIRKDNKVYTIVEEAFGLGSSKWGKLKSGAGWISLDFCSKVG